MDVTPNLNFNIPDDQKHIAVGLSGGGDSMALAHMICAWAVENNRHIHLLSLNHNLRDDAKIEASQIAAWVDDFPNSKHHILTWNFDEKPDTAVMERARNARYDLMTNYCNKHDIQTLCIAHHADDQLETFMFRLAKGSGLDGLTGMNEWSEINDVQIYRPLLQHTHQDLIDYCKTHHLSWIEDPSNKDEKYARPRLRKALEAEGFDTRRFAKTCERLSRAQNALDWMVDDFITKYWGENSNFQMLKSYPLDIQIRVLQKIIARVGDVKHSYPPKLERVEDIIATIKPSQSATLHGCVLSLSKDGNTLEIKRS